MFFTIDIAHARHRDDERRAAEHRLAAAATARNTERREPRTS